MPPSRSTRRRKPSWPELFIDNWRWAGVPFYLRTGKRLPKRASEVAIQFKDVPQVLFNAHPDVPLEPTVLSLRVQPEEGLSLRIASKLPGPQGAHLSREDGVQLQRQLRRQRRRRPTNGCFWT